MQPTTSKLSRSKNRSGKQNEWYDDQYHSDLAAIIANYPTVELATFDGSWKQGYQRIYAGYSFIIKLTNGPDQICHIEVSGKVPPPHNSHSAAVEIYAANKLHQFLKLYDLKPNQIWGDNAAACLYLKKKHRRRAIHLRKSENFPLHQLADYRSKKTRRLPVEQFILCREWDENATRAPGDIVPDINNQYPYHTALVRAAGTNGKQEFRNEWGEWKTRRSTLTPAHSKKPKYSQAQKNLALMKLNTVNSNATLMLNSLRAGKDVFADLPPQMTPQDMAIFDKVTERLSDDDLSQFNIQNSEVLHNLQGKNFNHLRNQLDQLSVKELCGWMNQNRPWPSVLVPAVQHHKKNEYNLGIFIYHQLHRLSNLTKRLLLHKYGYQKHENFHLLPSEIVWEVLRKTTNLKKSQISQGLTQAKAIGLLKQNRRTKLWTITEAAKFTRKQLKEIADSWDKIGIPKYAQKSEHKEMLPDEIGNLFMESYENCRRTRFYYASCSTIRHHWFHTSKGLSPYPRTPTDFYRTVAPAMALAYQTAEIRCQGEVMPLSMGVDTLMKYTQSNTATFYKTVICTNPKKPATKTTEYPYLYSTRNEYANSKQMPVKKAVRARMSNPKLFIHWETRHGIGDLVTVAETAPNTYAPVYQSIPGCPFQVPAFSIVRQRTFNAAFMSQLRRHSWWLKHMDFFHPKKSMPANMYASLRSTEMRRWDQKKNKTNSHRTPRSIQASGELQPSRGTKLRKGPQQVWRGLIGQYHHRLQEQHLSVPTWQDFEGSHHCIDRTWQEMNEFLESMLGKAALSRIRSRNRERIEVYGQRTGIDQRTEVDRPGG